MNYSIKKTQSNTLRIAIIGVDGSGKSSCFKGILKKISKKRYGAVGERVFVFEKGKPIKIKVKYLKIKTSLGEKAKFIENRKLYKILKFAELVFRVKIQDEIERKCKLEIVVTDGSPLINTMGWGNFFKPYVFCESICRETISYLTGRKIPLSRKLFYLKNAPEILFVSLLGIRFQKPDVVFFLKVTPETAVSRVKRRGEKLQIHETKVFLSELQKAYQLICKIIGEYTEIYTIDTEKKPLNQVIDLVAEKIQ